MFGDDVRNDFMTDDYIWNNSVLGNSFWEERIQESNMIMPMDVERNNAYLYEMYPRESKIIRRFVEEALDLEDYRGSFIYDEYPDKFLFLRMARRVADRYTKEYGNKDEGFDKVKPWVVEIVQVILANEIYRRKTRKRYW